MKEVLEVRFDPSDDELIEYQLHAAMNPPLGVIITEPWHMTVARAFDCDIVMMLGNTYEQALCEAQRISEESDRLVILIGATCLSNQTNHNSVTVTLTK